MDQSFVASVYQNWVQSVLTGRICPEATFFAITADEREAWEQIGFDVDGGWCTPLLSHAQHMKEVLASKQP